MEVHFAQRELAELCSDRALLGRRFGDRTSRKIRARISDLRAASHLDEAKRIPGSCCERPRGQIAEFTLTISGSCGLTFSAADDDGSARECSADSTAVRAIVIVRIDESTSSARERRRR